MSEQKHHPFHIVNPSPWPLLTSMAAFLIVFGTVLFTHEMGPWVMVAGLVFFLGCLGGWFRDVIIEAKTDHTPQVRTGFKWGMALFILSEVAFFASFFWAYFHASLFPMEATGGMWPPKGIKTLDAFDLPYLNTLLLLLSGTTVTWAHYSMQEGNMKDAIQKIMFTFLLGFIFIGVQALEYHHAPFAFKQGIYPSTFYMATGFHGAHVLIGAIFLLVCWVRARANQFTKDDHFGFEAAAWYWHFVDVVWLFLFVVIYWLGS